ncbi:MULTISPECIES: enoyl-CoA hydratase/isomerase family protein [Halomonadaceae]|uniref:enoyl-CoA hydratase/isomerase family protein n=1 Tax=Halomonadaceae TaxID=28256 RepID=UPI001582FB31|nr:MULTISPECIES: enoyl-CoA hydratase/isomerase family protein [Halomonas]MDI4636088.1 enoyl-CoA hydratase/isomerase family protein [Halomonas sp. BMC7]NUJ60454.1 enoyl-CoA hydratase/isomerase family protein [Halomonas taeanensis]
MTDAPVLFEERPTREGQFIGVATLNAPKALNALSLAMIEQLSARLSQWAEDERVVAVWLEGAGEKAFCAGGDIVALYKAIESGEGGAFAETYFTGEYALDYQIHCYEKPLLVWGDGIVMGGGMGLMAGAGYRLVTETSLLAMPEISIGLYPDIGASWFLNRMPPGIGAYLGLTGAQLNARDALDLGLADRFVPRASREALFEALLSADFDEADDTQALQAVVGRVLDRFEDRSQAPAAQLWPHRDHLQRLTACASATDAVARILGDDHQDDWLAANRARLAAGCPLSAQLVWQMIRRHSRTGLAEAFREELNLSVQCCLKGDLAEGVRALLIDKDKTPRWSHASVGAVPKADVEALLRPLWNPETHPLREL